MTEYITKEQAVDALKETLWDDDFDEFLMHYFELSIKKVKPADFAPVTYAKWKFVAGPDEDNNVQVMCDNCGAGDVHATNATVPYCWRCGARMDGGENDDQTNKSR